MKLRGGFISNSSSTSYVIVTTKQNIDECVKPNFSQDEQDWIDGVMEIREFAGIQIATLEYATGEYGNISDLSATEVLLQKFIENRGEDILALRRRAFSDRNLPVAEETQKKLKEAMNDFGHYFWEFESKFHKSLNSGEVLSFSFDC